MKNGTQKTGLRGFTLLETLVAVLILVMSITGPLIIAQKGLTTTLIAKDQVTAYFLAQDAVEYIHFKRDNACLNAASPCNSTAAWLSTLSNCTSSTGATTCTVDTTENDPVAITTCNGVCPNINYDSTTGRYSYTTGTKTPFVRTITITAPVPGNNDEAAVVVTVSWTDSGAKLRSVTTKEDIFNWE